MYSTPPPFLSTTDAYQYLSCPGSAFVQALVQDAGILVGFGSMLGSSGPEAATYPMYDQSMLPGSNPVPQACDAIRFKSMTPGVPARVNIVARPNSELPKDVALQTAYVPSYLVVNPDGTIGADFTGAVVATELDIPSNSGLSSTRRGVNFIDLVTDRTGTSADIKEQLLGSYAVGGGGIIQRFVISLMRMIAGADGVGGGDAYLEVESYVGGPSPGGYIGARAVVGGVDRLIADSAGQSAFPSWGPGNRSSLFQIQIGTTNVNFAAGWSSYACPLGTAWPTSHFIFIGTVEVALGASTAVGRTAPSGLANGVFDVNSSIAQAGTLQWISIGR